MSSDCSSGRVAAFIESARRGLALNIAVPRSRSMCVFGSDECSVAGSVASDYADAFLAVPVLFAPDTRVPGWVDGSTFAVLVSGSAERPGMDGLMESLSERGASFACVSPDGPLADRCRSLGGTPVRMDGPSPAGFCVGAVVAMMDGALSSEASGPLFKALEDAEAFAAESVPGAEALAESLGGRVPAVYSTSDITACSRWWRIRMCADVGELSFSGELPEFNHNELVGWSDPNVHAPELEAVLLRGSEEPPMVGASVGCMIEVLEENGRRATVVDLGGGDPLTTDLRGIVLGTMVSDAMGGSRWTCRSSISSTTSSTTSRPR